MSLGNHSAHGSPTRSGLHHVIILALALTAPVAAQFVQQGSRITANNVVGTANLGHAVAISADGNTAAIGADLDSSDTGAVFIYVRSGTQWTQQAKLVGDKPPQTLPFQGFSVALSSDGNTLLVGGYAPNQTGMAWVFTRSGTVWSQQTILTASDAASNSAQGYSVALSSDGNTALVGAPGDGGSIGAAFVFTRSGTTWTEEDKLVGAGNSGPSLQGSAVALSSDGSTALVGAYNDHSAIGAAWVFTRSGTTWTQQGAKLVGNGNVGASEQGWSVSLSDDGSTAAIGGRTDNANAGAVWIFTRVGTTWTQQGGKIVGGGAIGPATQGSSVSLSADGNALVSGGNSDTPAQQGGGVGAAWVFRRAGNTWTQVGSKLVGTGNSGYSWQGWSVAVDAVADTILVGAPNDNGGVGAAWVFTSSVSLATSSIFLYDPVNGNSYTGFSTGTGTFNYIYMPATPGFDIIRYGKITGGGRADLILYNSTNALGYTLLSNGDGTYRSVSLFWGPGFKTVAAGDLNGDGKTDFLIYRSTDGTSYTALSNGDGTFNYQYALVSPGFTHMALADFDGDGKADVFYYNSKTGAAYMGISDGTGGFSFSPVPLDPGYNFVETGDVNADGKADLVLYNATSGTAQIGLSDGAGFTFTPESWTPGFTTVKVFDYNGDGRADIALYNKTSTLGYLLVGDGVGDFTSYSLFWGKGYNIVKTMDVDGDGKQDVIIYNTTNGASYTGISLGTATTDPFNYHYAYWGNGKLLATMTAQP